MNGLFFSADGESFSFILIESRPLLSRRKTSVVTTNGLLRRKFHVHQRHPFRTKSFIPYDYFYRYCDFENRFSLDVRCILLNSPSRDKQKCGSNLLELTHQTASFHEVNLVAVRHENRGLDSPHPQSLPYSVAS